MKRTLHVLASCFVVALLGTGCKNAHAGTGSGTATTTRGQGVKFAECLRNNGVSDFPDPDAKGEFVYGVSVGPEVWKKAVAACKDLEPPGATSAERGPQEQKSALKFAQCMRDHGVKDFPDPVDGEPLVDTNRIPSSTRSGGMTILNAAMQTCRTVVEQGPGTGGE